MQPEEDTFQFMMEIDRLAADLYGLGDRSITELKRCVIIVKGLSADYEIEVHMLENNPTDLERAESERVVGKQITGFLGISWSQRLYRYRMAPPRQIVERRRGDRATDSRVSASTAEGRVAALRIAGARRRRSKNQKMPPPIRRVEVRASTTSVGVRNTLRINNAACAEAWSTRLAIVRSEELRRVRCWSK